MLVAVPGLAVQRRHFLLPAVCALLLVSLPTLTYGDGLPSGLQCGVTEPASEEVYPGEVGCGDDANEYVVRFLFVTFPNVLDTLEVQEQPLPTFADSVVADIVDYIRFISVDTVSLDARIEKRSGADSVYYWVTDLDSNDLCLSTTWATIDSLPPMGWNDNVDLVVYCLADYLCDQPMQPFTWGRICGSTPPYGYANNNIQLFTGFVSEQFPTAWQPFSRNNFEALLVHEMGHSFHFDTGHLPNGSNGDHQGCNGSYFACFCAMNPYLGQSCTEPSGEMQNNGLVPYHPLTMLRQGFLHPDTVRTTTSAIELGDIRLYKDHAIFIPLDPYDAQGFLIANHQLTDYDGVLGERGLAIWHYVPHHTAENCNQEFWVLDLEHSGGKWEAIDPGDFDDDDGYCRDFPYVPDGDAGVDALDCKEEGAAGGLWSGTAWTPGHYRSFDKSTHPNSNRYPDVVPHRLTAQTDTSGVAIRNIQAITDGSHAGKFKMRFDLIIDYPW